MLGSVDYLLSLISDQRIAASKLKKTMKDMENKKSSAAGVRECAWLRAYYSLTAMSQATNVRCYRSVID